MADGKAALYCGNHTISVADCTPVAPKHGEVQCKVAYCGVCGTDMGIYHGKMDHRIKTPQVIGHEMSGVVTALGEGVEGVAVGDKVVVRPLWPCEECPACRAGNGHICMRLKFIGIEVPGALQAYWTVPAFTLHKVPAGVSLRRAALIEPLAVACHDVRRARVAAGEHVVILGGGPIGVLIALVARVKQARVLIAEINEFRRQMCERLGFEVVNPAEVDVVQLVSERTATALADVVFEVSGAAPAAALMTKLARVRGRIAIVGIHPEPRPVELFQFFWKELEMVGCRVYTAEDFEEAIELIASEQVAVDPLITEVVGLDDTAKVFASLQDPTSMKSLVHCSDLE